MIRILTVLSLFVSACSFSQNKSKPENETTKSSQSFYDFKMTALNGKDVIDFAQFKGKKVLIVNVASKCGLTPQYADLQKLHEKYGDKLVILGFPANNFMGQEPGTNEEIATFCKKNYGVSFQMFEKVSVKGDDQSPLYKWLSDKTLNGWNTAVPDWNFAKYLINEKGELVKFFTAKTKPLSDEVIAAIQ